MTNKMRHFLVLSAMPALVSLITVSAFLALLFGFTSGSVANAPALLIPVLVVAAPVMLILGLPLTGVIWSRNQCFFESVTLVKTTMCGGFVGFAIHYTVLLCFGAWVDPLRAMPVALIGGAYAAVFINLFSRKATSANQSMDHFSS